HTTPTNKPNNITINICQFNAIFFILCLFFVIVRWCCNSAQQDISRYTRKKRGDQYGEFCLSDKQIVRKGQQGNKYGHCKPDTRQKTYSDDLCPGCPLRHRTYTHQNCLLGLQLNSNSLT